MYEVTFQSWRSGHGPHGEISTLGTAATLTEADKLASEHHGRPWYGKPVSHYPTYSKARDDAVCALLLIGEGTYRYRTL